MIWDWFIFAFVLVIGNYLMIGSSVIEISGVCGLYVSGFFSDPNGRLKRQKLAVLIATVFQVIFAVTISVLVLFWFGQFVDEIDFENPATLFAWFVGGIAAGIPSFQHVILAEREYEYDKQTWDVKSSYFIAGIITAIVDIFAIILLIAVRQLLEIVVYPLLILAGVVTIGSLVVVVIIFKGPKWREVTHRSKA